MKATIKGVQKVDYVSKKSNKPVNGVSLHIERKDPNVTGSCVETLFISMDSLVNLGVDLPPEKFSAAVGKGVEYEYNRFGGIAALMIN